MNIKELEELINSSPNKKWYESVNIPVEYSIVGEKYSFEGVLKYYDFLIRENSFWKNLEPIPHTLETSIKYIDTLIFNLTSYIRENVKNDNSENHLHVSLLKALKVQGIDENYVFTSKSPETKFIINVSKKHNASIESGAFKFLTKQEIKNSPDELSGAFISYEFKKINDGVGEGISTSFKSAFKDELNNLKRIGQETEKDFKLRIELSEKTQTYSLQRIEELKNEKEKIINELIEESKKSLDQKNLDLKNELFRAEEKIKKLEDTYEKKLQLSKPAEYWSTQAQKLRGRAWGAFIGLLSLTALVSVSLYFLLWSNPSDILQNIANGDKIEAVRWSIIFITFISFIAFGVRAITKVMFSFFHLSRDCEERSTLTYFYLSLSKNEKLNEDDRKLVIQSLFSRAETGLLKDDGSPSMPGIDTKLFK